jgi:hypothetical protein
MDEFKWSDDDDEKMPVNSRSNRELLSDDDDEKTHVNNHTLPDKEKTKDEQQDDTETEDDESITSNDEESNNVDSATESEHSNISENDNAVSDNDEELSNSESGTDSEEEDDDSDQDNNAKKSDSDDEKEENIDAQIETLQKKKISENKKLQIEKIKKIRDQFYTRQKVKQDEDSYYKKLDHNLIKERYKTASERAKDLSKSMKDELDDNDFLVNNSKSTVALHTLLEQMEAFFEYEPTYDAFVDNLSAMGRIPINFLYYCLRLAEGLREYSKKARQSNTFIELTSGIRKLKVVLANIELWETGLDYFDSLHSLYDPNSVNEDVNPELEKLERLMIETEGLMQTHQLHYFLRFLYGNYSFSDDDDRTDELEIWEMQDDGGKRNKDIEEKLEDEAEKAKKEFASTNDSRQLLKKMSELQQFKRLKEVEIKQAIAVRRNDARYTMYQGHGFVFFLMALAVESEIDINSIENGYEFDNTFDVAHCETIRSRFKQEVSDPTIKSLLEYNQTALLSDARQSTPYAEYTTPIFTEERFQPITESALNQAVEKVNGEIKDWKKRFEELPNWKELDNKMLDNVARRENGPWTKTFYPLFLTVNPNSHEIGLGINLYAEFIQFNPDIIDSTVNQIKVWKAKIDPGILTMLASNKIPKEKEEKVDLKPSYKSTTSVNEKSPLITITTVFSDEKKADQKLRSDADSNVRITRRTKIAENQIGFLNASSAIDNAIFAEQDREIIRRLTKRKRNPALTNEDVNEQMLYEALLQCMVSEKPEHSNKLAEINLRVAVKIGNLRSGIRGIEYEARDAQYQREESEFVSLYIDKDLVNLQLGTSDQLQSFVDSVKTFDTAIKAQNNTSESFFNKLCNIIFKIGTNHIDKRNEILITDKALNALIKLKLLLDQIGDADKAIVEVANNVNNVEYAAIQLNDILIRVTWQYLQVAKQNIDTLVQIWKKIKGYSSERKTDNLTFYKALIDQLDDERFKWQFNRKPLTEVENLFDAVENQNELTAAVDHTNALNVANRIRKYIRQYAKFHPAYVLGMLQEYYQYFEDFKQQDEVVGATDDDLKKISNDLLKFIESLEDEIKKCQSIHLTYSYKYNNAELQQFMNSAQTDLQLLINVVDQLIPKAISDLRNVLPVKFEQFKTNREFIDDKGADNKDIEMRYTIERKKDKETIKQHQKNVVVLQGYIENSVIAKQRKIWIADLTRFGEVLPSDWTLGDILVLYKLIASKRSVLFRILHEVSESLEDIQRLVDPMSNIVGTLVSDDVAYEPETQKSFRYQTRFNQPLILNQDAPPEMLREPVDLYGDSIDITDSETDGDLTSEVATDASSSDGEYANSEVEPIPGDESPKTVKSMKKDQKLKMEQAQVKQEKPVDPKTQLKADNSITIQEQQNPAAGTDSNKFRIKEEPIEEAITQTIAELSRFVKVLNEIVAEQVTLDGWQKGDYDTLYDYLFERLQEQFSQGEQEVGTIENAIYRAIARLPVNFITNARRRKDPRRKDPRKKKRPSNSGNNESSSKKPRLGARMSFLSRYNSADYDNVLNQVYLVKKLLQRQHGIYPTTAATICLVNKLNQHPDIEDQDEILDHFVDCMLEFPF